MNLLLLLLLLLLWFTTPRRFIFRSSLAGRFVTLVLTSVTKRPRVVQRSLRRLTRGLTRRSAGGVTFGAYEPPTPESPFRCEDVAKVECGGSAARLAISRENRASAAISPTFLRLS